MVKQPKQNEPPYITPKEFAYRYQVSHVTALRLAREGKIDGAVKIGGVWRMPNKTQGSNR